MINLVRVGSTLGVSLSVLGAAEIRTAEGAVGGVEGP